ncbi:MAG: glycoside hydrolase [Flavobacteriaceae bacterium]|nr:glycoside hydrolase [Flavobacteriaceae bacterium]
MKTKNLLLIGLLSVCFSCVSQTKKINGISFVASHSKIDSKNIQPVLAVNASYVALMPFGFIRDIKTPKIHYNSKRQWFGETKDGLVHYATAFKKSSVKIMIKPQVWVSRGIYTGFIKMDSEEDWKVLEESYEKFILDYAAVAQQIKAEILCIGTELEKFVIHRPKYWKQLIKKIKTIYKGKLTYAANWDEFKRVPFWDLLDYIGVDAYFPLSDKKTPTVADFEAGWQPHKITIKKIQEKYHKPILFTEYGYRSVDYNGKKPWESNRIEGSVNHQAQKNATQAIYNQFWNEKWFAGGFIWKWFHNHKNVGGINNNRFTPQNKPAEKLLKELYGKY